MNRKKIIAGNWKMNKVIEESLSFINELKEAVRGINDNIEIVVSPPFTALSVINDAIKGSNILLAGQDVFWEDKGAYTGEISPMMLKDVGCKYTIIGHSERRQYCNETNETVNKKIKALLRNDLSVIICVGETIEEREDKRTFSVVGRQIRDGLKGLTQKDMEKVVIAYEPVWAIGTGKTATPSQANEMHLFIRDTIKEMFEDKIASSITIQYGGSVTPLNITELMLESEIDGALVGGASLDAGSFVQIIRGAV
ncbi:MAG: triose-phosphate isomerase [Nitrospinae bacterium]|nr:triose-phosphate isomerase [Nitrospinota bacterium]